MGPGQLLDDSALRAQNERIEERLALSASVAAEISPSISKTAASKFPSPQYSAWFIDVLRASIKAANDAGKLVTSLRLNSEGGNLLEALRVADGQVCENITNVGQGATCASACFSFSQRGKPIRKY